MDETMFDGRKPGKRGWGASGKNIVFDIYPDAAKFLLFLSYCVPRRLCSPILPDTPKQEVYTIPTTGLPMSFCLLGVIMWSY